MGGLCSKPTVAESSIVPPPASPRPAAALRASQPPVAPSALPAAASAPPVPSAVPGVVARLRQRA
ncbi:hypothetical protein EON62_03525, partial [archaeon]